MPVPLCYICKFNFPRDPGEHAPSYDNCESCKEPTCTKHGRTINGSRFYCIRCIRRLGFA